MATDYIVLMGRIASAPGSFGPAAVVARDAVIKVVAAAASAAGDLDTLQEIGRVLGDDLEDGMAAVTPAQARTIVQKLDGYGTRPTPADSKLRLLSLMRGALPSPKPTPVTAIEDLGELRQLIDLATEKGDTFDAWLASQPAPRRRAALKVYDAPREAKHGSKAVEVVAHLTALARGAQPVSSLPVADMTIDGLRALRREAPSAYEAWIVSPKVKDAASRIVAGMDPGYPNVGNLAATAALRRLGVIADGGVTFPTASIDTLDVGGMRALQAESGDMFAIWLKGMAPDKLKSTMSRLDPNRPKVKSLKMKECLFLLEKLAKGAEPVAAENEARVIGEHSFPVRS